MIVASYVGEKALGVVAPEKEGAGAVREPGENLFGQPGPAKAGVAACIALACREGGVQKKNALIRPVGQVAGRRGRSDVVLQLAVDVFQRSRQRGFRRDRESQTVGMTAGRVRVLSEDDNAGVIRLRALQSGKAEVRGWKDRRCLGVERGVDARPVFGEEGQVAPAAKAGEIVRHGRSGSFSGDATQEMGRRCLPRPLRDIWGPIMGVAARTRIGARSF